MPRWPNTKQAKPGKNSSKCSRELQQKKKGKQTRASSKLGKKALAAHESLPSEAGSQTDQGLVSLLQERGLIHGPFRRQAAISQTLKLVLYDFYNFQHEADMREALEMILHKIARILNGNPNYADSWQDIAGYAQLIVKRLNEQ